jgi:hypothetical protein
MDIEITPIEKSSFVKGLGYDPATRTLRARLGSKLYDYKGVPEGKKEELESAPSVGKAFQIFEKEYGPGTLVTLIIGILMIFLLSGSVRAYDFSEEAKITSQELQQAADMAAKKTNAKMARRELELGYIDETECKKRENAWLIEVLKDSLHYTRDQEWIRYNITQQEEILDGLYKELRMRRQMEELIEELDK